MTREEILDKAKKIKALAEQGVSGEQANARKMLDNIMKKYSISDEDLDDDKETVFFMIIKGHKCVDLFKQIAVLYCHTQKFLYLGNNTNAVKKVRSMTTGYRPKGANMAVVCTKAQFLELQYLYNMLQDSFNMHVEGLFYAFLDKNDLLAPYDPDLPQSNMSEKEIDIAYKMSLVVQKENISKALPQTALK